MILTPTTTIQAQSAQSKWDPDRQQADCSVGGAEAAGARGTPASCCKPRHLRRDQRPGAENIQRPRHGEVDTFQMICCAQRDLVHVGELARLTPASRRRQEMTTSSDSQAGFRVAKRQIENRHRDAGITECHLEHTGECITDCRHRLAMPGFA